MSKPTRRMAVKPRIFKSGGRWWVSCKHGQSTGPYTDRRMAFRAAFMLWEAYGPGALR